MNLESKNYSFRTDLANETREIIQKNEGRDPDGIRCSSSKENGIETEYMEIINESGAKKTGKKIGKYATVNVGKVWLTDIESFNTTCDAVANVIKGFIPESGSILLAGLGNRRIIADAIGPQTSANFIVTRHIKEKSPAMFSSFGFRETSAITPGVLGNTGIEAAEIIKGAVSEISPSCLIVIDSLASRRLSRLATTVQICDTGISPGSGVENSRLEISSETMGIPVIAIGVPTVVDVITLSLDILEEALSKIDAENDFCACDILKQIIAPEESSYFVTPKETDVIIKDTARLLGYALNMAIHKNIAYEDMADFLS